MNKRQTTLFATIAAAAVAVSMAGCSNPAPEGSDQVLTIAAATDWKAATDEAVAGFEASNPGVTVKVTYAGTDSLLTTLRTQLSSGTAPDVFPAWPGYGNAMGLNLLQEEGLLTDLSDLPFASEVPSGISSAVVVDDKTWALPMTVIGIGALYNADAVKEAGAKVPTTFDEVIDFCHAATAAGKVGFAVGLQDAWTTQLVNLAFVTTTVYADNPDFDADMNAGKVSIADSGWKTSFDLYIKMKDEGCFNAEPLATSFDSSLTKVATGDALAVVQVTAVLPSIKAQAPEGTEFGIFALPATNNPDDTWIDAQVGIGMAVNPASKQIDLAKSFINYLASPAGMAKYATSSGALPAIPTDLFKVDPALQVLVDMQAEGKSFSAANLWPNPQVQQEHLDGVQKVFAGSATVEEVLAAMDAAFAKGKQ